MTSIFEPGWGNVTATLDWCEENYMVHPYIAEFWNTVTNIPLFGLGLYGAIMSVRFGLEKRFIYSFSCLALVGFGSWCFHATLLHEMQLLDELPMIYGTIGFLFCMLETERALQHGIALPLGLAVFCVSFTYIYVKTRAPLFHQFIYVSAVIIVVALSRSELMRIKNVDASQALKRAVIAIITAAILWIIDNECCGALKATRAAVGEPFSALFQFHGWWHILTAYATYTYLIFAVIVRLVTLGHAFEVRYAGGIIPVIKVLPPKEH